MYFLHPGTILKYKRLIAYCILVREKHVSAMEFRFIFSFQFWVDFGLFFIFGLKEGNCLEAFEGTTTIQAP